MSDFETTLEVKGLDKLIKALKAKTPRIRVGILGDKAIREAQNKSSDTPTNAEVGAYQEFGTTEIPQRSFLRVPISEHLGKEMEAQGALDKAALKEVVASGTIIPWAKKIAIIAVGIVDDAFETAGFGKWKPSNMANKKVKQTLVETGQLRKSIDWEVK